MQYGDAYLFLILYICSIFQVLTPLNILGYTKIARALTKVLCNQDVSSL